MCQHENYLQVMKSWSHIKLHTYKIVGFILESRIIPNRQDLHEEILVQPKGWFF